MKREKVIPYILIFGIPLIVISPILFTQIPGLIDFTNANTNNIGGTIGGITAPFTSVLGSILVYYALKAQIDANALIQEQLTEQKATEYESKVVTYLKQQLDVINKDIDEFRLVSNRSSITGSEALFLYLDGYLKSDIHHDLDYSKRFYQVRNIKHYITLINELVNSINTENIPEKDKLYLTSAIKYHYNTKVKPQFDKFENEKTSSTEICTKCGIKHYGIPDELYEIIDSINNGLKL
jgi:hypothetical protein